MTRYFEQHAQALIDAGYKPIPIRPGSKDPFVNKGESWQVDVTQEVVKGWLSNGKAAGGVGLTGLAALDVDIKDRVVSNKMVNFLKDIIIDPMIRVGWPPKFLVPLSPESDVKKKRKFTAWSKDGIKHEIELLSPGDQYFVAFGVHPDTGKEYSWIGGSSPLTVAPSELPALDSLDLASIEDKFFELADAAGWLLADPNKNAGNIVKPGAGVSHPSPGAPGLDDIKMPGRMADAAGLAELKAWLDHLEGDAVDDRDQWIKVGAAIHHETGGSNDGWGLFDDWSRKSSKYVGRKDTLERWESFSVDRGMNGSACTAGSIVQALKDLSEEVWIKAKKAGDKAVNACEKEPTITKKEAKASAAGVVSEMNKKHAVVSISGKCRIMNHISDSDIDFSSVPDFHHFYANTEATDPDRPKKKRPTSQIWWASKDRRQYSGIVFEPGLTDEEALPNYNLWRGLAIQPVKGGDWSLFKRHIIDNIACGKELVAQWVIAWVARIIQDPGGDLPGTAIVLRGKQGTGKGIFVNMIGKVFGNHYLQVSHASHVTGRFNSHLKDKVMIFVDEGFWAGDKKAEGVIKSIITEPFIAIEQKGMDVIRVRNHVSILIASNNDWVVPAGPEERRFFVIDVSDSQQQNSAYFRAIAKQMHNGGLEAMVYDLMNLDISGVDLRKFEQTSGLFEQKLHSMDNVSKWWFERLMEGALLSNGFLLMRGTSDLASEVPWGEVWNDDLYGDYIYFANIMKEKHPLSKQQLANRLVKIAGEPMAIPCWRNGKTARKKMFSPLPKCRALFSKVMHTDIAWEQEITKGQATEDLPF